MSAARTSFRTHQPVGLNQQELFKAGPRRRVNSHRARESNYTRAHSVAALNVLEQALPLYAVLERLPRRGATRTSDLRPGQATRVEAMRVCFSEVTQ